MSPDMFKGILCKAKELVEKADCYMAGKTPDGLIIPIQLLSEIDEMILDCERVKTEITNAIKGLTANSKKKPEYQELLDQTVERQSQLKHQKEILLRDRS